jgi:Mg-chelatase subunit ChlD
MLASAVDWQKSTSFPANGPAKLFEQQMVGAGRLAQLWPNVFHDASAGPADGDEWQAALTLSQFPTGRAWLSLALSGNSTQMHKLENQRFQAEFGTGQRGSSVARFTLPTNQLPEGSHAAIAWFRGHSATSPVTIYQRQPPIILAWEPEELGATTIRVSAETKPSRIVFVLDCSGSLGKESMQAAKDTLIDVIRELSKLNAGQTEIAVILFGHTSEYSKTSSTAPDLHSAWPGRKNRPYNDVELVQELAFPSPQVVDSLEKKLANLQSFGRTPLYESLLQAITMLTSRNDGFKGDLRVVAITDGADNVLPFTDPADNARAKNNYLVPKEYIHTEQDPVRRAAGQVSLDFVPVDQKEGLEQLKRMATATGGSVYQANSGNLAEQLRNSIARDTYSTQNLKTKQWVGSRLRLSAEQSIPAAQIPGLFEVTVDNTSLRKSVQLLGGETIELQYQRQVGLTFLPYDEGDKNPQRGEFTLGGQPFQAIMLTANPVSVPQVRICLQSTNPSVQSIRPKQFVLELRSTQSGQDGQGTRLAWTSDGMWENHHNSPVLRVVIKNAPRFYPDRLECRLWLGPQTDRPSAEVWPVARLKEQAVEVVPGVSASAQTEREAGGLRLTVTEKRTPEAPLIHWQVQPAPDKFVEHQVHATQVVHEYFFTDASVLAKLHVVATPLPLVPKQDWQATQWIPVPEWK